MNLTYGQRWFLIIAATAMLATMFICMLVTMFGGDVSSKTDEETKLSIYQKCLQDSWKFDDNKDSLERFQQSCYDAAYKPLQ